MTEEDLKTHMFLEQEEKGPTCPLCNLCELTLEELEHHMNTAHEDVLSPAGGGASTKVNANTRNAKTSTPLTGEIMSLMS